MEEKLKEQIKNRMNLLEIHISRVPKHIKKNFIDFANEKFCGDYGVTLAFVFEQAEEYKNAKNVLFSLIEDFKNGKRR